MIDLKYLKIAGGIVILAVAGAFMIGVWSILIPFIAGLAISYLVYPMVDRFVAIGLRQDRVVLVLYLLLLGSGILLLIFFLPNLIHQAQAIAGELPSYAETIDAAIDEMNEWLSAWIGHLLGRHAPAFEIPFHANGFILGVIANLPSKLQNVAHWGLWLMIVPFVSFFGLTQGRLWIDKVFQWTPSEHVESLLGLLAEINATLGGYIRGLITESALVGFLTMGGLWVLGLDGFVFLGVLTGCLNIVPFMAPIVGGSIALLTALLQGASTSTLFAIVGLFVAVRILDDFLLVPFVIGRSVQLHPVLMVFAVLAGYQIGGVLGLLVAIPTTAVLKVIFGILLQDRREHLLLNTSHIHI